MTPLSPAALAARVPDEPGCIDLRGLLLTGRCDIWADGPAEQGFVATSWDFPFAALHGRPRPGLIETAAASGLAAFQDQDASDEWQLLAPPGDRSWVQAALPGWRHQGVVIHRFAGRPAAADHDPAAEIRLLPEGHRRAALELDHLPGATRRELDLDWVSGRPMAVALVDSRPVTFCYAAFATERLWDVSIETLEPYRRRGLAAACFLALAGHLAAEGLTPTWGALADNTASMRLAAHLGFVRDALLDGWTRGGQRQPPETRGMPDQSGAAGE